MALGAARVRSARGAAALLGAQPLTFTKCRTLHSYISERGGSGNSSRDNATFRASFCVPITRGKRVAFF